jgi:hypothetical protein
MFTASSPSFRALPEKMIETLWRVNYNDFSAEFSAAEAADVLRAGANTLDDPEKGEALESAVATQGSHD